jgi:pantoate--beta-alanine ligase
MSVQDTATQVIETKKELSAWRKAKGRDCLIGFVPTMGALHEGHMSLVHQARQECDFVVVSIFVNPLQFGVNEDLSKYPRPFEKDLEFCRNAGVDLIFHPSVAEMYADESMSAGENQTTVVPPQSLISTLCGAFRPGHFVGVATVVLKLFNMVQADIAYFGEKDYQQLMVVRRMVADLNVSIKIVGVPTARDNDGLALSSRNIYLNSDQRKLAPILHQVLSQIGDDILKQNMSIESALARGKKRIAEIPESDLQYLEVCHADTLETLTTAKLPMVILVACKLGTVRLIDNIILRNN